MLSGMLYQTYSELDVVQLLEINEALENELRIPDIEMKSILATFEGHTLFSIYDQDVVVYDKVYSQI